MHQIGGAVFNIATLQHSSNYRSLNVNLNAVKILLNDSVNTLTGYALVNGNLRIRHTLFVHFVELLSTQVTVFGNLALYRTEALVQMGTGKIGTLGIRLALRDFVVLDGFNLCSRPILVSLLQHIERIRIMQSS